MTIPPSKIRVLLVDDSAIVRGMMQRALKTDPQIDIIGTAANGAEALELLAARPADIIILDIEMPVMDGLAALPEILKLRPRPRVIMASTLTKRNAEISLRAMELGADDYVTKPSASETQEFFRQLAEKIKALVPIAARPPVEAAAPAPVKAPVSVPRPSALPKGGVIPAKSLAEVLQAIPHASAIAIASSTGGPQALLSLFTALKGKSFSVPVFITQHMPPNFTTILAEHITRASGIDCHEARDGEDVRAGTIYLAPGDYHMTITRNASGPQLRLDQNPPENFCRPSADPMFRSLAAAYGNKLVAVVLTGMGSDGSPGAAEIVRQGGMVAAQNEATCVVYGMPRAVVEAGFARAILPLDQMAPFIAKAMRAA